MVNVVRFESARLPRLRTKSDFDFALKGAASEVAEKACLALVLKGRGFQPRRKSRGMNYRFSG